MLWKGALPPSSGSLSPTLDYLFTSLQDFLLNPHLEPREYTYTVSCLSNVKISLIGQASIAQLKASHLKPTTYWLLHYVTQHSFSFQAWSISAPFKEEKLNVPFYLLLPDFQHSTVCLCFR
jgi:hypothetical protein